ncbi:hypothetical protein [Dyadobacter sp. CY323]|uniref:hypothetical protein n=1 Tax=Dyadobacter sp. CY323 TaxID=2907302 RepID=UPI001F239A11|nr:hypothetical protein [Dyadobacter sp. CY323]MCE6987456.1 hypothetical protein [Dyadobacter sp. CY323]
MILITVLVSCKDRLPSTPTIVTGRIIDENGDPLEGAGLRLSGSNLKGFSGYDTFSITAESDRNGMYQLSQVAPEDTEQISIASRSTSQIKIDNQHYKVYVFADGQYHLSASPYDISRSAWGKTTTINYQFIKQ